MNTDEVRKRFEKTVLHFLGYFHYNDEQCRYDVKAMLEPKIYAHGRECRDDLNGRWIGYQQATKESEALQESFDAAFATCKDLHAEIKRLKAITGLLQYKASKAIDELEEVLGEDDDLVADLWYDYGKDCEGLSSVESRAKQALKEADR